MSKKHLSLPIILLVFAFTSSAAWAKKTCAITFSYGSKSITIYKKLGGHIKCKKIPRTKAFLKTQRANFQKIVAKSHSRCKKAAKSALFKMTIKTGIKGKKKLRHVKVTQFWANYAEIWTCVNHCICPTNYPAYKKRYLKAGILYKTNCYRSGHDYTPPWGSLHPGHGCNVKAHKKFP